MHESMSSMIQIQPFGAPVLRFKFAAIRSTKEGGLDGDL